MGDWSREAKEKFLEELDLGVNDEGLVVDDGDPVEDKYIGEAVPIDDMLIVPGSTLVLRNNPVSIIRYFEEYGDPFAE